jgi:hypothetical protein
MPTFCFEVSGAPGIFASAAGMARELESKFDAQSHDGCDSAEHIPPSS